MLQISNRNIKNLNGVLFFCFLFVFPILLSGQEATFSKKEINHPPNKIYFNVLQLKNTENVSRSFFLELLLPDRTNIIGFIPKKFNLKANETKYIPIRLQLSKSLNANTNYLIKAKAYSNIQDTVITTTKLKILPSRNIKTTKRQSALHFAPGKATIEASVEIYNEGNVDDGLSLTFDFSNEINVECSDKNGKTIRIEPGKKHLISFQITPHNQYKNKSFDNGKLSIFLNNNEFKKEIKFSFKKLLSEYDFSKINGRLPDNMVELFIRESDLEFPQRLGLKAKGKQIGNAGTFNYRLMTNNIFNTNDFFDNYYIDINYRSDLYSFGYGTTSSDLGEGLYKQNSFFLNKEFKLGESSSFLTHINSSIREIDAGGAIGYSYENSFIETTNSISYNYNKRETRRIASFVNSTSLSFDNSSLDYYATILKQQLDDETANYNAYEHSLNYMGKYFENRLSVKVSNNLKLKDAETGILLYTNAYLNSLYNFSDDLKLSFSGSNNIYNTQINNENIGSSSNTFRTMFYLPNIKSFSSGIGINHIASNRNTGSLKENDKSYSALLRTNINFFKFKTTNTIEYGSHNRINLFGTGDYISLNSRINYTPFLNTQFQSQLNYSQGEIVKFTNEKTKQFRADATIRQSVFDNKLGLNAGLNYAAYDLYNTTALTFSTGIDYITSNNYKIKMNFKMRKTNTSTNFETSMIEASVAKYFNIGSSKNNFDLNLLFFKDLNSNGIHDDGEEIIEGIQVYLQNENTESKFKSLLLVSDNNGITSCKNIPKGKYNLNFVCLDDLQGFYNFNPNNTHIFSDDTDLAVPYSKAGKISGTLSVFKTKFSSVGLIDIANIRVKAVDVDGKTYSTLTDAMGNFTIYVPQNREYTVSINEIFGAKFELEKNNIKIDFFNLNKFEVDFVVREKKRRINFSR